VPPPETSSASSSSAKSHTDKGHRLLWPLYDDHPPPADQRLVRSPLSLCCLLQRQPVCADGMDARVQFQVRGWTLTSAERRAAGAPFPN
jgi:hypothetical protein